jgi:hypothetical protein
MMTRRTSIAVAAALMLAFAATSVSAAPILSDVSLVCAQPPASAAADAANSQITPDDPNVGNTACARLCKSWVGKCKGIVGLMKGCWLGASGKVAGLRNATCAVLEGAAKDSCKDTVKSERQAVKDFIKTDVETGKAFCEGAGLAQCILNCS